MQRQTIAYDTSRRLVFVDIMKLVNGLRCVIIYVWADRVAVFAACVLQCSVLSERQ